LRGYGQKDPLIEYKKESYVLFVNMLNKINTDTVKFLFNVKIQVESDEELELKSQNTELKEERRDIFNENSQEDNKKSPIKRDTPKVGRNDPCPCGSGKKYKKCCGANEN
jgi:preprotein translocase subunit SecA